MTTLHVPAVARPAWETLSRALTGYEPPCASQPDRWQSSDPNDVQAAAAGCRHCQVLTPCGEYADAARESVGVWAGVNRDPRSPSTTERRDVFVHHVGDGVDRDDLHEAAS